MDERTIKEIVHILNPKAVFLTSGKFVMTNCLFASEHKHKDRKPSAGISIDTESSSVYFCHGCKFSSSFNYALQKYFEVDGLFKQDLKEFVLNRDNPSEYDKSPKKEKTLEDLIDDYFKELPVYDNKTDLLRKLHYPDLNGRQFLATKGIHTDIGLAHLKQKENLIYIPYYKNINNKFICVGARCRPIVNSADLPKYFSTKDFAFRSTEILYNEWGKNLKHKKIFIVEGELDAIHLIQYGIPVVALGGTSWNNHKLVNLLTNIEPDSVLISADTDDPGQTCNEKIYESLKEYLPCKIVQFGKDPKYIEEWRLKLWYLKTEV